MKVKRTAVFLDRDGTIMRDVDYCGDPNDVDLLPGAPEALRQLKSRGYKLIVITNQSGIGRGLFSEQQYRSVEAELAQQIGNDLIDATYFCPHLPQDGCKCRKPSPEMVLNAARDHNVDLARSFFVGDKSSDVECGRNAGVKTVLVRSGIDKAIDGSRADWVAEDLREAVQFILRAT